jgi:hypothetical protein
MNHTRFVNADAVTILRNPSNCATLTPILERTIRVQDRCRNNRITRQAATLTAMREVQYP